MSTVKSKKYQVGTDATSSNNFTIYQPATPDGTLRIGVGNADNPTEVAQFNSTGITLATGKDLTLSSTALDASASGIYLGGTSAANLLDDYEEGTWTPTTNSDATGAFTNANGVYVKVGQMVTVMFQFNVATSFTNYFIGGLPFLVKAYGNYGTTGYAKYTTNRFWRISKNATTLYSTSDGETAAAVGACRCVFTYRSQL